MANPAPTINQINAFNATQGTTIDFNIIGGTELVRSNRIYIYDLSDNSLICTHLYASTESIHELPPNTDGSIVYESGKSSADFVNGAQYYAQIQTFTDIAGTEGGSGLSVAKMFWCLVDPTLTITTIPSSISTTSYNVSATYDANTSVVSNIIQQYQFSLYSATGSLLQSSGVIVGSGTQQGTSTAYDISYNFTGLSVGSSYYVVVDVTTTQGMSVSTQSSTFTVSIDTPTLGEATVVNNACDGYISVTSNLSGEYGGSGSGDIVSFETDSENVFSKLQVTLSPTQTGSGTASPDNVRPIYGVGGVEVDVVGKNLINENLYTEWNLEKQSDGSWYIPNLNNVLNKKFWENTDGYNGQITVTLIRKADQATSSVGFRLKILYTDNTTTVVGQSINTADFTTYTATSTSGKIVKEVYGDYGNANTSTYFKAQVEYGTTATDYEPYTETTVSQEFDVSLTPTSKDTDPYLFKAVGDIYGDRLEEELVGGTVCWNQLVQNGDFASTSGWSVSDTIPLTVNSNIATFSATSSAAAYAGRSDVSLVQGHKYICVQQVKPSKAISYRVIVGDGSYAGIPLTANVWNTVAVIHNQGDTYLTRFLPVYFNNNVLASGDIINVKEIQLVDLTKYFGNATVADYVYGLERANAGAGVAWLQKYFPDLFTFSPYDSGTLKSVTPTAHVTRGVNAWDEEWENGYINSAGQPASDPTAMRSKNFVRIVPNTIYYGKSPVPMGIRFYDENQTFIGTASVNNATFTTPTNAQYLKFYCANTATYNNDICINISDPTINGKYFPYEEHTYDLGNVPLYGLFQLVDNKLKAYGDVRHAEGGTDRKFALVDLGTLNYSLWNSNENRDVFAFPNVQLNDLKSATTNTEIIEAICPKFIATSYNATWKVGEMSYISAPTQRIAFVVPHGQYADASAFKSAMSGVYLLYPLATPTTETTTPFTQIQEVSKYGTLEYITTNGIPVGHNTTYLTRDVFGGYIDLVSGQLVVDKGYEMDLSRLSWGKGNTASGHWRFSTSSLPNVKMGTLPTSVADALCSEYDTITANETWVGVKGFAINDTGNFMFICDESYADVASFKTALKNVSLCYPLANPLTYQLTPQQIQTLVGVNNVWSEQGDIELSYHIPITNLLVKRQDVDDVSGNWLTLYSQPVEQASDMNFTFIDFLNQYGKTYKYALVPLLTQTQSGVEVEVEGGYTVSDEVQSIFDGVFISDSTGSQKCKANVGYGNVNMNQSVGSITPIGSQYPIIVTNSNNRYHNGSISGMIVPDDYYYNGNLSRIDMVNKRNELEQFLTNKRAKIIKDWNSNIWLVMIMDNIDCSFDNNYGMGIVTFNANWLEVGDPTNQEDLQATGLVDVGGV